MFPPHCSILLFIRHPSSALGLLSAVDVLRACVGSCCRLVPVVGVQKIECQSAEGGRSWPLDLPVKVAYIRTYADDVFGWVFLVVVFVVFVAESAVSAPFVCWFWAGSGARALVVVGRGRVLLYFGCSPLASEKFMIPNLLALSSLVVNARVT